MDLTQPPETLKNFQVSKTDLIIPSNVKCYLEGILNNGTFCLHK